MTKRSARAGEEERRIALYGGVFDPVHNAHLSVARAALEEAGLDGVVFIPAACSPHKKGGPLAADEERLAMLYAATAGEPAFRVDACELERGGVSFSVDTASRFRAEFPGARLFWIIGADQWERLPDWHRIGELSALVEFLVVARPGYRLEPSSWPGLRHSRVAAPLLPDSSSGVRERVAAGRAVTGLVDPAVEAFISANNLYK